MGLYLLVSELEYLQGIGAGAGVRTSGERGLAALLDDPNREYTIFDVGANVGEFTATIYPLIDDVMIHLFEPQRAAREAIFDTFRDNPDTVINGVALSDAVGERTLHYDTKGSTMASFTQRRLDHLDVTFDGSETVETTTIDRYCDRNGVDKVDLLKLDVEGHELDVLRGAEAMIDAGAIDYVSFEFGGANIDTRTYFQDYFTFLKNTTILSTGSCLAGDCLRYTDTENLTRSSAQLTMSRCGMAHDRGSVPQDVTVPSLVDIQSTTRHVSPVAPLLYNLLRPLFEYFYHKDCMG